MSGIDAGSIYSEVRIALDKLTGDIKQTQVLYDQLGTAMGKSTTNTEKKINTSLNNINLAHIALFAAITAFVKKSVTDYASFEQALANVQSVARASAEDMKILEKAAGEAGQTTKFTGKQAADAMYYLASAGFTAMQSVEALDGVLALASATQADLAFTSETVASAISQFGLKASDSLKVANVFAAGIAKSQATIDKLATSMRYVGPVAAAFGYSIEQVTGTLSILYNAGFEASQAGTALRSVLADLSNAASPAVEKLKALGIAFEDVNPAANSLADVIAALNPIATNGGKIMEVFGDRAGPAMIKLLQAGAGEIEKYTEAVTGTNQALDAAAIQNNTLQFALARLGKGFSSIGKSMIAEFAPALKVIANFVATLLFGFSQLPAPLKTFFAVIAIGIPVLLGLTQAWNLLKIAFLTSPPAIIPVLIAIAGLAAGISALASQESDIIKVQKQLAENTEKLSGYTKEYSDNNKKLEDSTKKLNSEERKQLEQRQAILGLKIKEGLRDQIDLIGKLTGEIKKQNTSVDNQQKRYNEVAKILGDLQELKKIDIQHGIMLEDVNMKWSARIKEAESNLSHETTTLSKNKLALEESIQKRQEAIDWLANSVNAGLLDIATINLTSAAIGKEVFERAKYLKTLANETAAKGTNNGVKGVSIELTSEEIEANKALQKTIQKTREQLEDLNATELQKIKFDRARAIAEIKSSESSIYLQNRAIAVINSYYNALIKKTAAEIANEKALEDTERRVKELDAEYAEQERLHNAIREAVAKLQEQRKADEGLNEKANSYIEKLKEITDKNYSAVDAEREREIAAIRASGGSEEAMQAAIDKLNEYYDALKDKTATEKFIKNMTDLTSTVINGFNEVLGTLSDIGQIQAQQQIDAINQTKDAQIQAIDEWLQAELEAQGLAEETTIQRLQRELAEAVAANNQELIAEKEKELAKQQLIESAENQKISVEKQAARDSAEIKYKADHASWEADNWALAGKALLAEMQAWTSAPWPWNLGAIAATTAGTAALIYRQKLVEPKPPTFQQGGIVLGSPQGTIIRAAENNSNELLLNDSPAGKAMIDRVADAIINRMATGNNGMPAIINLYLSENLIAQSTVRLINDGVVTIEQRGVR